MASNARSWPSPTSSGSRSSDWVRRSAVERMGVIASPNDASAEQTARGTDEAVALHCVALGRRSLPRSEDRVVLQARPPAQSPMGAHQRVVGESGKRELTRLSA